MSKKKFIKDHSNYRKGYDRGVAAGINFAKSLGKCERCKHTIGLDTFYFKTPEIGTSEEKETLCLECKQEIYGGTTLIETFKNKIE